MILRWKRISNIHDKIKSQSFDFFGQIEKIRYYKFPNIWPPFFQSDVFCTLYICSGVTKGYRGEDKALEMDWKVGGEGDIFYFLW
jgi:hypothetical protein